MTPAARDAAAMEILDRWLGGQPVEAALTGWARASRFAGSRDRAAVRDIVFDVVRRLRTAERLGGARTGRALLIGLKRADGLGAEAFDGWTGEGYAPAPLTAPERAVIAGPMPDLTRGERVNLPDWMLPRFDRALGPGGDEILRRFNERAPVFARLNARRADGGAGGLAALRAAVIDDLAAEGIEAAAHPLAPTALLVTGNARRLRQSSAFLDGRIELQDAASQVVALDFHHAIAPGCAVLDYCAGGGGKSLALAAMGHPVTAFDIDPRRMRDIPARARRAGVEIEVFERAPAPGWPAILVDAPCSGSGSWRRAPEAKWTLTPERLTQLTKVQDEILSTVAGLVAPGGIMGYATCSIFAEENEDRVNAFLARHSGWIRKHERRLNLSDGGDGFFLALLQRV